MTPEEFQKRLIAAIEKTKQKTILEKIGNEMAAQIKKRTRLGYGVNAPGQEKFKLPELSEKYREARKTFPKLSDATTPNKSNLTRTGQMLDSIKIKSFGDGTVTVGPEGSREGDDLTNEKLAEYVSGQGRTFNTLSKPEINGLIRFINDLLKGILKL